MIRRCPRCGVAWHSGGLCNYCEAKRVTDHKTTAVIDGPGRYATATDEVVVVTGRDVNARWGCEWQGYFESCPDIEETWASSGLYRPYEHYGDDTGLDAIRRIEDVRLEPSGTDLRRESLREVEACVCKDRQNTYGDAEDNFAHIAAIASVVLADRLKEPLTALDVAAFSACIKLARIRSSPMHGDNWCDLAGYAVCGHGIVKREKLKTSVLSQP